MSDEAKEEDTWPTDEVSYKRFLAHKLNAWKAQFTQAHYRKPAMKDLEEDPVIHPIFRQYEHVKTVDPDEKRVLAHTLNEFKQQWHQRTGQMVTAYDLFSEGGEAIRSAAREYKFVAASPGDDAASLADTLDHVQFVFMKHEILKELKYLVNVLLSDPEDSDIVLRQAKRQYRKWKELQHGEGEGADAGDDDDLSLTTLTAAVDDAFDEEEFLRVRRELSNLF